MPIGMLTGCAHGTRAPMHDVVIPPDLPASDILIYLDDIFHEMAGWGQRIELIVDSASL